MKSKFLLRVIFLLIFYVNSILTRLNLRQATSFPEFHRQNPPPKHKIPFSAQQHEPSNWGKQEQEEIPQTPRFRLNYQAKANLLRRLAMGGNRAPGDRTKSQTSSNWRPRAPRLMRGKINARRIWSDKESIDAPDVWNCSTGGILYRRRRCRSRAEEWCTKGERIASVGGCFLATEYLLRGVKRNNSSWLVV